MVLTFVESPSLLPEPPSYGRVVLADVAFAYGGNYQKQTLPFVRKLGSRLAGWIDHHDHPAWPEYAADGRFVLIGKKDAPACPQIVTPALLERLGSFEHVVAHADFDGCMTAAKLLRGGTAPYPEADEDARSIDYPGHGYLCSARGLRLASAMDQLHDGEASVFQRLLAKIVDSLVSGFEAADLAAEVDGLAEARAAVEASVTQLARRAVRVHPDVLLLELDADPGKANRKLMLRKLEEEAAVGIVREPNWTTVATTRVDGPLGLDLSRIPGLKGQAGYAFGRVPAAAVLEEVLRMLEKGQ